ncbi:hypothetical protein [Polaromonas vacuolata]|uniref:hypothetical protein n=1 Tax=Polaromonas vacuolata TaxID=37448 RepID=UPI00145675BB|nr:hypothetical protein [Polaromonas vacuolata]
MGSLSLVMWFAPELAVIDFSRYCLSRLVAGLTLVFVWRTRRYCGKNCAALMQDSYVPATLSDSGGKFAINRGCQSDVGL